MEMVEEGKPWFLLKVCERNKVIRTGKLGLFIGGRDRIGASGYDLRQSSQEK